MAPLSLYDMSIPVFIRALENLSQILKLAVTHAKTQNIPLVDLLNAKLVTDMDPLPAQIQRASDSAKGVAFRLGGHFPVPMDDKEKTFEELQERIQKTLDILKAVDPHSMDGKEDVELDVKSGPNHFVLTGKTYLQEFALPNFFFHHTTAYAILRSEGVPIGKMDYLGNIKRSST